MNLETVIINGHDLTVEQVVAVARYRARVELDPAARARVERCRAVVDRLLESETKVYGLTTGFGSKRDVFIGRSEVQQLQRNLVMSHACGVGRPLDEDQARATMLLRANTLALGVSGVRPDVIDIVLNMLNEGVFPYIPCQGSLGASGDLAPLSHLGLVIMGHPAGRIFKNKQRRSNSRGHRTVESPNAEAFESSTRERLLDRFGIEALELEAKEGLAINNGTQMMTGIGVLTLYDAEHLVRTAEIACAASVEAIKSIVAAYDERLHAVRPYPGQVRSAANLRRLTADSTILQQSLNMALVASARRLLEEARGHLERDTEVDVSAPIEAIDRVRDLATELVRCPETALETQLQALDASKWPDSTERQRHIFAWRFVLAPMKRGAEDAYRQLLALDLGEESVKSRESVTRALDALERAVPNQPRVQDDYSTRCMPQVAGAVRTVISQCREALTVEMNAATDNPLIFPPELDERRLEDYRAKLTVPACVEAVTSGGNFHGEPVAFQMDFLAIGIAELGNISERRTAHLTDGNLNNGLPSLLIWKSGLNSGFMIPQYTAASLVSENKVLSHPASVDSIPSCENTEDHVSMGSIAARKARTILENVEWVVAIELLNAYQALHFRRPLTPGPATQALVRELAAHGVELVEEDRPLYEDMDKVCRLVRTGRILAAVETAVGPLE